MHYKAVMEELLEREVFSFSSTDCCVSAYIPNENFREKTKLTAKSQLLNALKAHDELNFSQKLHQHMIGMIDAIIDNFDDLHEGVAVFFCFSGEEILEESLLSAPLHVRPKPTVIIDKTYHLEGLIAARARPKDALVLSLNRKTCVAYWYETGRMEIIFEHKNHIQESRKPEYLGHHGVPANAFFGTGSNKLERDRKAIELLFLDEIGDRIKEHKLNFRRFDKLLIFYSDTFYEHTVFKWVNEVFSATKPDKLLVQAQYNQAQILSEVKRHFSEFAKYNSLTALNSAKEESKLIRGWKKIADAARERRIERLFIHPENSTAGFVVDGHVFTDAIKGGVQIENVAPWLIGSVLKNGGDVILVNNAPGDTPAAQLRY